MIQFVPEIENIKDETTKRAIRTIFENAGNLIAFDSVPTLSDMESNTIGYYGNNVYIKTKNGTGIVLTGAAFT